MDVVSIQQKETVMKYTVTKYAALAVMLVASFPLAAKAGDHFRFFLGLPGADLAITDHHVGLNVAVPAPLLVPQPAPVCAAPVVVAPACPVAAPVYAAPVYAPPVYFEPSVVVSVAPRPYYVDRFHEYRPWGYSHYYHR
jgi:hypothetical protein